MFLLLQKAFLRLDLLVRSERSGFSTSRPGRAICPARRPAPSRGHGAGRHRSRSPRERSWANASCWSSSAFFPMPARGPGWPRPRAGGHRRRAQAAPRWAGRSSRALSGRASPATSPRAARRSPSRPSLSFSGDRTAVFGSMAAPMVGMKTAASEAEHARLLAEARPAARSWLRRADTARSPARPALFGGAAPRPFVKVRERLSVRT